MPTLRDRADLIKRASADPKLQAGLYEKCRRDILFWFNNFCWTYNPREKPYNFPFNLYGFQEKTVLLVQGCIQDGEPLLIKKSRDMGLTWIVLLVFQHFWLYEPGSAFHMTSITEDDVDKIGDISTLFGKLRYNLDYLPVWLKPAMGKNDDGFMKLVNPENGNIITGQAPVTNFGRSRRYKAVLMDEMAQLRNGGAMYSSVSHSTKSIIMPYTPYGKDNEAFRLSVAENLEKVSVA
jgi:phage terminase large subunit